METFTFSTAAELNDLDELAAYTPATGALALFLSELGEAVAIAREDVNNVVLGIEVSE